MDFINDSPKDRLVLAQVYPLDLVTEQPIQEQARFLHLWEGAEYDAIGDWTQDDANARIIALLTA